MSLLGFSLNSRFRRLPVLKAGLPYVTEAFSLLPKPIISPFLLLWVNNTIARPAAQLGGALSLTSCTQSPAKACPVHLQESSPPSAPTSWLKPLLTLNPPFHRTLLTGFRPQNFTLQRILPTAARVTFLKIRSRNALFLLKNFCVPSTVFRIN